MELSISDLVTHDVSRHRTFGDIRNLRRFIHSGVFLKARVFVVVRTFFFHRPTTGYTQGKRTVSWSWMKLIVNDHSFP